MRLTNVLLKQHLGYHFKKHWHVQGKRRIQETGVIKFLTEKGIRLYQPEDILGKKDNTQLIEEVPDYIPQPLKLDNTHPDWHDRICYTYRDDNALLGGLDQAKIITNTIELQEGLPDKISIKNSSTDLDRKVKKIILNSHIFDAEQKKLPKIKDPERPAWNFPRVYGITESRVNTLVVSKLLQLVEMISDPNIVKERSVLYDLEFWYPFEKAGDLFQLQLRADTLVTSLKPIAPITDAPTDSSELPDIFPIKHTITLNPENIYKLRNLYPINTFIPKSCPHTIFVHYNNTEVKNLYEEEVTENQILGRSLMKTFTVAASYARQKFGENVGALPTPVTVQCVHTDGRLFHFGILQLNTLDTENKATKNIWYHTSRIPLFDSCRYNLAKPTLDGYNNAVIKHLIAFYNNV